MRPSPSLGRALDINANNADAWNEKGLGSDGARLQRGGPYLL